MAISPDSRRALAAANASTDRPGTRAAAAAGATLTWGALALQLALVPGNARASGTPFASELLHFASYFTILTNTLVAVTYTARLAPAASDFRARFAGPWASGAIACYIAVVGLVYYFLLRNVVQLHGAALLADTLLHYVSPIAYVLFWLAFVRHRRLRWRDPLAWLAYPLAYVLYTAAHGALTRWYPYPFINVGTLGYAAALRNAAALLVAFWVMGLLVVVVDRTVGRGR